MAKYTGAKCRLSRREKTDLMLKSGIRAIDKKCKIEKIPGMHWQRRGRTTNYGIQLRMKQLIRRYYGVLEKQFRRYYQLADKSKGSTGETLLKLLESRLDNVVYRMGFAATRAEARQLVNHKAIIVNGKVVNIPSFIVKPGSLINLKEKAKKQLRIGAAMELAEQRGSVSWIEINKSELSAQFSGEPIVTELPAEFKINLVVELYSK